MATIPDAVRQFAEEPEAEVTEPLPPARRILTPAFSLLLSATQTQGTVCRVRTTEVDLDRTLDEIRGILREKGERRWVWCVGPSCRPENLPALLAARGFVPATRPPLEPALTAMALVAPPAAPPENVEARLVRDYDEYLQALRIAMEAFGESEEDAASWMAAAPELWKQQDGVNRMTLIAYLDGKPVGFAFSAAGPHGLMLAGSGVLPQSRGHGVYRGLVSARWDAAVRLGKPALVIHAGAMSQPILERCAFEQICRIDVLEDPAVG